MTNGQIKNCGDTVGKVESKKEKGRKLFERLTRIKSPNYPTKSNLVDALANLGYYDHSISHFVELLKDKESYVKMIAADVLGEIGTHKVVPHLAETLKADNGITRNAAAMALVKIRSKLIKSGEKFSPSKPAQFTLMHIDPKEFPKAFDRLLKQLKKRKNMPESHWILEAKELMAVEGRLK